VGEFGGVLEPRGVSAAHVVLRESLDLLEELHGITVEPADELVDLVRDPDGSGQILDAGLRLQGLCPLQVGHCYECPATAERPSGGMM
jgi:hypothetical protein